MKSHGESKGKNRTTEYVSWAAMRDRCNLKSHVAYPRYGGRGITICKRWMKYENFLVDMGRKPSPEYTLERIKVNGNYTPKNCRWATPLEQGANTRSNNNITFNGKTLHVVAWAKELGIQQSTIDKRLKAGWPPEMILSKNNSKNNKPLTNNYYE